MRFPKNILETLKRTLEERKKGTETRLKSLTLEDPFSDRGRLADNAASDTEAKEEVSHERVAAIKAELEENLAQIQAALAKIEKGKFGICENCGKPIGGERLKVVPTARFCIECKKKKEK